jgi:hypothetical protein
MVQEKVILGYLEGVLIQAKQSQVVRNDNYFNRQIYKQNLIIFYIFVSWIKLQTTPWTYILRV